MASDHINLIFDLDGTLVDSQPGIIQSLSIALAESGYCTELFPSQVPVGPPLLELVQSITNCHEPSIIDPIILKFKEHYDCSGFISSCLFNGVYDFLLSLYNEHFNLFIATNKRLVPTLKILEHFSIASFFKDVYAVDSFGIKYPSKAKILAGIIRDHSLDSNIVYIGDRHDDYLAASENLITFCYPLWGYTHEYQLLPIDALKIDLCAPSEFIDFLYSKPHPSF